MRIGYVGSDKKEGEYVLCQECLGRVMVLESGQFCKDTAGPATGSILAFFFCTLESIYVFEEFESNEELKKWE